MEVCFKSSTVSLRYGVKLYLGGKTRRGLLKLTLRPFKAIYSLVNRNEEVQKMKIKIWKKAKN